LNKNFFKLVRLNNWFGLLVLFLLCTLELRAQNNNYIVFFTDKNNSPYAIDRPEEFLSAMAIDRRNRQQIEVITEDLPINPSYLQGLAAITNVSVRQVTKWMNGALVQATPSAAETIKLLPYVSTVEFIAPANVGGRVEKKLGLDSLNIYESDTLFQFDILGIADMRADGYQGNEVLVAVMDGGFEGMPGLTAFSAIYNNSRVIMTYDFLTRTPDVYRYTDHGTKVMSLLAARQNNPDYAGVVPDASFMLFVTEDIFNEYRLEEYRWLVAAEKADSAGADIISSSLGYNIFDDSSMNYDKSQLDGVSAVITRAAQKAFTKGILVVTSGGNTGLTDPWRNVLFPGDIIGGLAVGSITSNNSPSAFSPRGPTADNRIKPDVVAYGSGTFVINKFGNIVTSSGTSFSAPQVAGLAAGILQAFPDLKVSALIGAFHNSSSNAFNPDNELGYGVPSYRALRNYIEADESETWFVVYPNPVINDFLRIKVFDPQTDNNVQFKMFDTLGKAMVSTNLSITWQNNEYFLEMSSLPQGIYILNLQSDNNFSQVKILKL
jgi:subtilisin family serine protease